MLACHHVLEQTCTISAVKMSVWGLMAISQACCDFVQVVDDALPLHTTIDIAICDTSRPGSNREKPSQIVGPLASMYSL